MIYRYDKVFICWGCDLNRNVKKMYEEIQNIDFFRKQNCENCFSSPGVLYPMGLASIMF